jgi:DNA invertase Pin-like site-specific DNA recombinase
MPENAQVRAGGYLRISSDPKDKRQGVKRQREDVTSLCDLKGWKLAGFYEDNDRSASSGKERPEWDRLMADIKAGKIDAIAAWDQDRGWRMMSDLEALRRFISSLDRKVLLATTGQGDIDLYSPTGIMYAQLKTMMSEHEIGMMRVRQLRAARQRALDGIPKWKHAFGYLATDPGPVPDPVTAPLVVKGYRAIGAGASLKEVATMWNDAGAFGRSGKPWNESLVSQFLRKPRNCGLREHNNEIVGKATWQGLVDEALWRAAQNSLDSRPNGGRGKRRPMRKHLLSGLMLCGKDGCGGHLNARHIKEKIKYTCTVCHGVSVRAEDIEPLLIDLVGSRLARKDAVNLLRAEIHDQAEAQRLRDEKAILYSRKNEMAVEWARGLVTGQQLHTATEIVDEDIRVIERKEQDQERLRVFDGLPLGTDDVVAAVARLVAVSPDRFRAVLSLICKVTIAPVGKGSHVFNPRRVIVEPLP